MWTHEGVYGKLIQSKSALCYLTTFLRKEVNREENSCASFVIHHCDGLFHHGLGVSFRTFHAGRRL
jgi:hypothetical protein